MKMNNNIKPNNGSGIGTVAHAILLVIIIIVVWGSVIYTRVPSLQSDAYKRSADSAQVDGWSWGYCRFSLKPRIMRGLVLLFFNSGGL